MSIYVEILVRAPMDALWAHTQTPELHERWDLRFSEIDYLPRASEAEPQRFRYATRIGFGLEVAGEGESVGEKDLADGSRSSALKFSSADPRSIIREGSGYWKYIPAAEGIRFLTWYDYRTRFGAFGAFCDRLVFQPMMGWATAWSFDRLRLWLEEGIDPAQAMRQALVHGVSRVGLALIFIYHGLVPKLLGPHADEVAMLRDGGIDAETAAAVLIAGGIGEILFGLCLLLFWTRRWPPLLCLGLMLMATVGVAVSSPQYLGAAFNPVSLNLAITCLAVIDLIVLKGLPSAARCRRRPVSEAT
ncbi:MAG: DoxX-like family protein [Pyrinomonadaceae bacterium]|nr:DoxX-like family protein [Pyrinomonadaceae bacterium]